MLLGVVVGFVLGTKNKCVWLKTSRLALLFSNLMITFALAGFYTFLLYAAKVGKISVCTKLLACFFAGLGVCLLPFCRAWHGVNNLHQQAK
jgi:hypothetical protein